MRIPRSHPRYASLMQRERLVRAWKAGIVVPEGLIAHGRGEAWDYLMGEGTSAPALVAERAAAAYLLAAHRPVISVNGNVAALNGRDVVRLAKAIPARIPGLESKRALANREGIFGADVVLVPLEDGDRAEALVRMKKTVISIDLNPLSRTSQRATIAIVDELTRAVRNIEKFVNELKSDPAEAARVRRAYRKDGNLRAVYSFLEWRIDRLRRGAGVRPAPRRKATKAGR